jgi:Fe-S-cluster containining protein
LSDSATFNGSAALCLECGMCCNGVIFGDVKLRPRDNPDRLEALGLPLVLGRGSRKATATQPEVRNYKFAQPCAALDGCRCTIYAERPEYCRGFECMVLKQFTAGRLKTGPALEIIGRARRRVEKVNRLLDTLGDSDPQAALSTRFRRTGRRLERVGLDSETADTYGQLTLAMHDLNLLLAESFYR